MASHHNRLLALIVGLASVTMPPRPARADDLVGVVKSVDIQGRSLTITPDGSDGEDHISIPEGTAITADGGTPLGLSGLKPGVHVIVRARAAAAEVLVEQELTGTISAIDAASKRITVASRGSAGGVEVVATGRTAISTASGSARDLSDLEAGIPVSVVHAGGTVTAVTILPRELTIAGEFWENFTHNLFKPLLLFFYAGFLIPLLRVKFEFPYAVYQGLTFYLLIAIGWHGGEELAALPARTLGEAAGFMGIGFLTNGLIGVLAYLLLRAFTRLRRVDAATVAGYYGSDSAGTFVTCLGVLAVAGIKHRAYMPVMLAVMEIPGCLVALYLVSRLRRAGMDPAGTMPDEPGHDPNARPPLASGVGDGHGYEPSDDPGAVEVEREMALEKRRLPTAYGPRPAPGFSPQLLHEVFLNPGIYLLFIGIAIGYISRRQGAKVTAVDDPLFLTLFQGLLCLFLLEMGMTASRKLRDLKAAGWRFVAFGLVAPNLFAGIGIAVAVGYSHLLGRPFEPGTYVLFAVLCGAASYIAVPAIQRLAIPEACPTLPLAASLGLTFSYNVTVGIPIYIEVSKLAMRAFPVGF